MINLKQMMCLGFVLTVASAGVSQAQTSNDKDLANEVAALRAELAEIREQQDQKWINERRSEEMRALVRDVLSDADTRASLQEGEGVAAGHDGKNFFLQSTDGSKKFRLNISGQIQVRYIWNHREEGATNLDDNEYGFQIRRTKLNFNGHVINPKLTYDVTLAMDREDNNAFLEDAVVGYEVMDGLTIEGGRQKLPFLREELTSSKRQLAVERGIVTEVFTLNRGEGIWVIFEPSGLDMIKLTASINDGAQSGNHSGTNDFHQNNNDFSVTGRIDAKLAGEWKQMKDFSAWKGEPLAIFLGAAGHYQTGDYDTVAPGEIEYIAVTGDASLEVAGANLFAAINYAQTEVNGVSGDFERVGVMVQGGYMVVPDKLEPFARYEWLSSPEIHAITAGANYYINKHAAKFTVDVLWVFDGIVSDETLATRGNGAFGHDGRSAGLGLLDNDGENEDQFVVRAQFQLLF